MIVKNVSFLTFYLDFVKLNCIAKKSYLLKFDEIVFDKIQDLYV
jgi:hypothetical protein